MSDENGPDDVDEFDDDNDDDASAPTALAVLEYLTSQIVSDPDAIEIDEVGRSGGVDFHVTVASGDMGRVIGRRGRVAQAIRTVVRAAGTKDGVDVGVEFVD